MTKIIKKYESTENTARIIELGAELAPLLERTKNNQYRCVELATKIGQLLNQEKASYTKEMGRGTWEEYANITFERIVSPRNRRRYMQLAAISRKGTNELAEDYKSEFRQDEPNNVLRNGILALDMLPKKEAPKTEGDRPVPRINSHLALITKFKAWHVWFRRQNDHKNATPEQVQQLLEDFRELITFCKDLEGGRA